MIASKRTVLRRALRKLHDTTNDSKERMLYANALLNQQAFLTIANEIETEYPPYVTGDLMEYLKAFWEWVLAHSDEILKIIQIVLLVVLADDGGI